MVGLEKLFVKGRLHGDNCYGIVRAIAPETSLIKRDGMLFQHPKYAAVAQG